MSKLKWLYPGMKVKRWLGLMGIGVMLFSWGLALAVKLSLLETLKIGVGNTFFLSTGRYLSPEQTGLIIIVGGIILISLSIWQLNNSLLSVVSKPSSQDLVELVYKTRHLERGLKILVIGGGTGLSILLRGLKNYTSNINAAVTMADDGGSSGRIRRELGVPPPGDLRNCLVALADSEPLMTDLFQYRFKDGSLEGQSFGNLLIAAMTAVTDDFAEAVRESSRVLAIRGQVLPSTLESIILCAELSDGSIVEGESNISSNPLPIRKVYIKPFHCQPSAEYLEAIEESDAIVIGPGSLYTSILPNLLIEGVTKKISQAKTLKIYVCNVMTQPGETDGYKASDHIKAIFEHTNSKIFDYCLVNEKKPKASLLEKYQKRGSSPVVADTAEIERLGVEVIRGNFINESDLVRHDSPRLAKAVINLILEVYPEKGR